MAESAATRRIATADHLMMLYIVEREYRAGGQIQSARLYTTQAVSKCCKSMTIRTGKARRVCCLRCQQPCDLEQRYIPRSTHQPRSGATYMHVSQTRIAMRGNDKEDQSLDRWMLLASLIEPTPRASTNQQWWFTLTAWECFLDGRCSLDSVLRLGNHHHPGLGKWTEWVVKKAIWEARRKVLARACYDKRRRIWEMFRREVN